MQDYSVVVRYSCFLRARDICPYTSPVRMTVRSGNVVSRVDADTQQPAPQPATRIRHVQGLLDLIREAIDRHAYRIVVSYDSTYGYPALIDINYLENGLDDEIQITVTDFRPLR